MLQYLSTLHVFVQWLGLSLLLTAAFVVIYMWITPQRELQLIREGNVSAAVCLCGALFGYVVPLASAMEHGVDIYDFVVWSGITLAVQIMVYLGLRLCLRDLTRHITEDRLSIAILVASICLAAGILDAAALTP